MNVWSFSIGSAIHDDSFFLLPVSTFLGRDSLHNLTLFPGDNESTKAIWANEGR
jgi:hypothetical protein